MEQIGLEAVFKDQNFQAGISRYNSSIATADKKTGTFQGGLKTLGTNFQALTGFSLGAAGGIALIGETLHAGIQFLKDSVSETVDYNKTVREMMEVTGLAADEISRIIQVGDDWGISTGELRSALEMMNKKGVSPTIENLAKIADEYVNAEDKSAFAEEANKKYGRSFTTLVPLIAKGGDELRAWTDAVDDSLIATDESIAASREYEVAVDNLGDAWQGFKQTVGNAVIPILTDLLTGINDINNAIGEEKDITEEYRRLLKQGLVPEIQTTSAIVDEYGYTIEEAAGGTQAMKQAVDDYYASLKMAYPEEERFGKLNVNVTGTANDLAAAIDNTRLAILGLTEAEFAKQAIDALNKAFEDGAIAEDTYTVKMVQMMQFMGETGSTIAATLAMERLSDQLESGEINAAQYADKVRELYNELKGLDGLEATTRIHIIYDEEGQPYHPPRQHGGPVRGGKSYLVGEAGPELFVPNTSGMVLPNSTISNYSISTNNARNISLNLGNITITNGMDMNSFTAQLEYAMQRALQ